MIVNSRDPWKKVDCDREGCMFCTTDRKGECWNTNATYQIMCKLCKVKEIKACYQGESGRSLYTRTREHCNGLRLEQEGTPLYDHNLGKHPEHIMTQGDWEVESTGVYRSALERQTAEGILITEEVTKARSREGASTMVLNSKQDFHQAGVVHTTPRRITSELN